MSGNGRSRWIAVAVMTATFMAGGALGYALPRLIGREAAAAQQAEPRAERESQHRRHSIFDELDLTPEQQAKRDSILEKRRREMDRFWTEHGPQMRAIVDSTRAEIDRMLTPEQRAQVEEFREKRRQQREEWKRRNGDASKDGPDSFGPPGPPGPPPAERPQGVGEPEHPPMGLSEFY